MLESLGLKLPTLSQDTAAEIPAEIADLAERRWLAKNAKDWPTADSLRKELESLGWLIKDNKDGYQILPK
jgi:cysteinyl-tRNA synthetase